MGPPFSRLHLLTLVQTGAGTVTELGAAGPADKVAIIGLGGVGLAGIMVRIERHMSIPARTSGLTDNRLPS